ncbi:MAG: hypothetical protein C0483_18390 [Pirellula sp.]|nr:hypothetical protein [Pirellula sp.]
MLREKFPACGPPRAASIRRAACRTVPARLQSTRPINTAATDSGCLAMHFTSDCPPPNHVGICRRAGFVRIAAIACACVLRWADVQPVAAQSLTPESPEVRKAVAAAVAYLDKLPVPDDRLGAQALVGRVMVYQGKPEHPHVKRAVEAIRFALKDPETTEPSIIYSLGLSLVFLLELDPQAHTSEIGAIVRLLQKRQKAHGGWGYLNMPTGDTSMTQYGVYGLWTAEQHGFTVPDDVWRRALKWLTEVQDVGGAWPYQGEVPTKPERIAQREIRRSMTEAAMASLYLAGNHFLVYDFREKKKSDVSPLLKPVDESNVPTAAREDAQSVQAALSLGAQSLSGTDESFSAEFPHYHLYTIERFQSFRAAALHSPGSTKWYDDGVRFLLQNQRIDGSWQGGEGEVAGTAFSVLFLIRSTRVALAKVEALGPGTLYGGRGIPLAGASRTPSAASVAARPEDQIQALLKQLDDPNFVQSLSGLENLQPAKDKPAPNELTKRLLELAKGDSPESKAAALRALGRSHDLTGVPILIEAIHDENPTVHQAAVDGLRFLARETENYGKPLSTDAATRGAEAKRWTEWYRKIRPVGP